MNSAPRSRSLSGLIRSLFLGCVVVVGAAAPAAAEPLLFTDLYAPGNIRFTGNNVACSGFNGPGAFDVASGSSCDSLTFSLSLQGFNPVTDRLTGAIVSLGFHDDDDRPSETVSIQLDALFSNNITVSEYSSNAFPFIYSFINPLEQFQADGTVLMTIRQLTGDFWFDGAGLVAVGDRLDDVAPVPEPASLLLMASGAGALARNYWRRRRQQTETPAV